MLMDSLPEPTFVALRRLLVFNTVNVQSLHFTHYGIRPVGWLDTELCLTA